MKLQNKWNVCGDLVMNLSPEDQIQIHVEITNRYELGEKIEKKIIISRGQTYILGRSNKQANFVLNDDAA